jgi:large subunit ribosomal protein L5
VADRKVMDAAVADLTKITGQKPVLCQSKKSIASFKLRENLAIGAKVTLRGERMWEFLDRLVTIATPRIRDFRGYNPRAFDGRGNYTLGVREQIIFPEIDYDTVSETRGLDIAITTSAATDEEAFELLLGLGFPFAQEGRPGSGGPTPEEEEAAAEEARKEEARQRAEAEQAALEQLKEENPEAYEKPEPADEDAEGDSDGEEE